VGRTPNTPQRPTSRRRKADGDRSSRRTQRRAVPVVGPRETKSSSRRAAHAAAVDPAGDAAAWQSRIRRLLSHYRRRPADGWPAVFDRLLILARNEIAGELERIDTLVRIRRAGRVAPELWDRHSGQRFVRAWVGDPSVGIDALSEIACSATAALGLVEDAVRQLSDQDGAAGGLAADGVGTTPTGPRMAARARMEREPG